MWFKNGSVGGGGNVVQKRVRWTGQAMLFSRFEASVFVRKPWFLAPAAWKPWCRVCFVGNCRETFKGWPKPYNFLVDPDATFAPGLGEMWFKNGSVEPARPCCFPVLRELVSERHPARNSSTTWFHHSSLQRSRCTSSVTPCTAPRQKSSRPASAKISGALVRFVWLATQSGAELLLKDSKLASLLHRSFCHARPQRNLAAEKWAWIRRIRLPPRFPGHFSATAAISRCYKGCVMPFVNKGWPTWPNCLTLTSQSPMPCQTTLSDPFGIFCGMSTHVKLARKHHTKYYLQATLLGGCQGSPTT